MGAINRRASPRVPVRRCNEFRKDALRQARIPEPIGRDLLCTKEWLKFWKKEYRSWCVNIFFLGS